MKKLSYQISRHILFGPVTGTSAFACAIAFIVTTASAAPPIKSVAHDSTLTGDGTSGSPLGVAVPLVLSGLGPGNVGVLQVENTASGRPAAICKGGPGTESLQGGPGLRALGGNSDTGFAGGAGLDAQGGDCTDSVGGQGGIFTGGSSASAAGGIGLVVIGGKGNLGGAGIVVLGGEGGTSDGLAGSFEGDVFVTGTLTKGAGSFKIDHPLDPQNKYLSHSFVESPDMKNLYDGNVTTDDQGEAAVQLPDWFEALNRDFRYQLTVIGTFAQAMIASEIKTNRFVIKTSAPGVKVSWQVTGIRKDAYAEAHRIVVEEPKPQAERGKYLHPEAFHQPAERGQQWARSLN